MRSLVLGISLGFAAPAHALSCAFGPDLVLPSWDDAAVPTNAVFHVRQHGVPFDEGRLEIQRADDGAIVPSVAEPLADADHEIVRLTPSVPLDPATGYVLYVYEDALSDTAGVEADTGIVEDTDGVASEPWELSRFTTGEGADTEPPGVPTLLRAAKQRGASPFFGAWENLRVLVTEADEPVLYRLEIDEGERTRVLYTQGWPLEDGRTEISVGQGPCGGEYDVTWKPVSVRVTAIDRAGQASEQPSDEGRTGCSVASASASPALWLPILGLLGARRRRSGSSV